MLGEHPNLYWSIDAPGLTEEQAESLAARLRASEECPYASAVDPRIFMTRHMDRDTVEIILAALTAMTGRDPGRDALIEDFTEWLETVDSEYVNLVNED